MTRDIPVMSSVRSSTAIFMEHYQVHLSATGSAVGLCHMPGVTEGLCQAMAMLWHIH